MKTGKEYKINEIKDILKIPTDRLGVFFEELAEVVFDIKEITDSLNDADLIEQCRNISLDVLTWIDDGEKKKEFNLSVKDQG